VSKEIELWNFVADRLRAGRHVILLVVATSSGSSPGREGYKMAVSGDGQLCGSIGGGVMEMRLVDQARAILSEPPAEAGGLRSFFVEQVHRKDAPNASGMICSGKQTVIFQRLTPEQINTVEQIVARLAGKEGQVLVISPERFDVNPAGKDDIQISNFKFEIEPDGGFHYAERLGKKHDLYIIGGGHCSLALSELMSRMDFSIRIFDDRPELNTIEKNAFADQIILIDTYANIGEHIPAGERSYVVVMTVGYASDEAVIRSIIDREFKYLGVLGSRAKMATLLKQLRDEGYPAERLDRIRTPIGLSINSHSPEEIAVSIAAEIIAIKNS
jgi:xanthine dehydrogenase accessory factor